MEPELKAGQAEQAGVPASVQTTALIEWLGEEIARVRERIAALESASERALEQIAEADVIRRHVMFHPERFTPSERDTITERAQTLAGERSRLEAEAAAARDQIAFAETLMASLQTIQVTLQYADLAMAQAQALAQALQAETETAPEPVPEPPPQPVITQASTLELLHAIESERLRIARDLHDGPAQLLADLVLRAEILERVAVKAPETFASEMDEFKNLVRHSVSDIRRFMFELRPDSLDDLGLAATMRRVASEYQDRTGITCRFNVSGEGRRLPPQLEEGMYRIIQEALLNVQRHAKARTVEVSLAIAGDTASLRVKDDGEGFDPEVPAPEGRRRLGLVGMRERAEAMGGTLDVSSTPGRGTEVVAAFPIPVATATG